MNETREHPTLMICPNCGHQEDQPEGYVVPADGLELICRGCGGKVYLKRTPEGWETTGWVREMPEATR